MPAPDLYGAAGQQYGIDPLLLQAQAQVESGGNPLATSPAGAEGLMQIMPQTAAGLGVANPYDPTQAVPGGARYLAEGYKATGSPAGAVAYYHGGPNQANWGPKTQAYVAKVAAEYQKLKAARTPGDAGAEAAGATVAPVDTTPPPSSYDVFKAWGVGVPTPAAAPTPTPAEPAAPTSADIFKAWGVGAAPKDDGVTTITVTPNAPAVSTPDLDATMQRLRAGQAAPDAPPSLPPPTPDTKPLLSIDGAPYVAPNVIASLAPVGAGLVRGARDVIDPAAEFLARHLSPIFGGPSGADVAAGDANALTAYTKANRGNALAGMGRAGGQIATTLPIIATGAGALGAAGEGLAAGADAVAPALGTAARGIDNFVSGSGGGNMLARALSRATAGAGQGTAVGALTSGQSDQPIGDQIKQGAETGAVLGGAVIPAVAAAGRGAYNALTNSGLNSEVANLANAATSKFGIPLRADQVSASPFVQKLGQMVRQMPGSGLNDGQIQSAFTRAVGKTFGLDTDSITQPAIIARRNAIGDTLNSIESAHAVKLDDAFQNQLANIESTAHTALSPDEANTVSRVINGVLANVKDDDTISGETFGNLIHKGSPLDAATDNQNSNIASAASAVKEALRGALARSLPPDVQKAYQDARFQYKNLMTVAPLVVKGAPGEISPAALQSRVNVQNGPFGQSGDLGELAQIGQRFLKEPRDSGTPLGMTILHAITRPGALLGELATSGLIGGHYAGASPLEMLGGVAAGGAGLATNRLLAGILNSRPVVNRLIRSGLANGSGTANPLADAIVSPQMLQAGVVGTNRLIAGPNASAPR